MTRNLLSSLSLLLLLSLPALSSAQEFPPPTTTSSRHTAGPLLQGGLSTLDTGNDDLEDITQADFAFGIGLQANTALTSCLDLRGALMYVRRGYETNARPRQVNARFDYLRLPLALNLGYGLGAFRPRVFAGVYGAYLLRYDREIEIFASSEPMEFEQDIDPETWDLGAIAGVGVDVTLSPVLWLTVDVQVERGFTEHSAEARNYGGRQGHDALVGSLGLLFEF